MKSNAFISITFVLIRIFLINETWKSILKWAFLSSVFTSPHNHHHSAHTHFHQQWTSFSKLPWKNATLCVFIQSWLLSPYSFESYRCAQRSSFMNGKQWRSHGTKPAPCGGCGKMVRSNFSLATMVVCEVCDLVLSCCSRVVLGFWAPRNCCFKVLSVAVYHYGWWWSHLQGSLCE